MKKILILIALLTKLTICNSFAAYITFTNGDTTHCNKNAYIVKVGCKDSTRTIIKNDVLINLYDSYDKYQKITPKFNDLKQESEDYKRYYYNVVKQCDEKEKEYKNQISFLNSSLVVKDSIYNGLYDNNEILKGKFEKLDNQNKKIKKITITSVLLNIIFSLIIIK